MVLRALPILLLLLHVPGDGWALGQGAPREVKRLYWELLQKTDISLLLIPEDPRGKPSRVNLVFQATFPGRAERDPYSGLPREPQGPPARLVLKAQAQPMTVGYDVIRGLVFEMDGTAVALAGPGKYQMFCSSAGDTCSVDSVEAELEPSLLRSLITAQAVQGEALGFPIKLTGADQLALMEFATRIGLVQSRTP